MILSIDASTKSSGFAIFNNQNLIHYECATASSTNIFRRIDKMIAAINKLLEQYDIDKVIIEDVYLEDVHNNVSVYHTLIYLQGFILYALDKAGITKENIKFFNASEWRKKCGIQVGRGIRRETLKQKDINFVKSQFGVAVNDDIADAICLGFAAVGGIIKESQVINNEYSDFEFG